MLNCIIVFFFKVIYALVTCCPIVTPGFFDDLVQAVTANTELPSPDKYVTVLVLFYCSICLCSLVHLPITARYVCLKILCNDKVFGIIFHSFRYMPAIKEDLIDPSVVSFHPNEARKHVFAGKLFLFLEKKQVRL